MIEIKGEIENYIVKKEDIKSIQRYSSFESYVYVSGVKHSIVICENEYHRLKKLLCKDSDKE